MTAQEALTEILMDRALTVKAGDVAGHQFHGNQYGKGGFDADKEYGPKSQKHKGWTIERTGGVYHKTNQETGESHAGKSSIPPSWRITSPSGELHEMEFGHPDRAKEFIDKKSVKASLPGNRHAAADYSGDSMLDRMKEHDAIRTNTAIADPSAYQAHTASISAYEATKKAREGIFSHDDAGRLHAHAETLHTKLGNTEHAQQHASMAQHHFEKSGK